MLTDENVEKENETFPPALCFFFFISGALAKRMQIIEKQETLF